MVALKYSISAVLLLMGCASLSHSEDVSIESLVTGCFGLNNLKLLRNQEPIVLTADVEINGDQATCPCKSAVTNYSVFQMVDGIQTDMLSGNFTVLGKSDVTLPVAAQSELLLAGAPVVISLSCGGH